MLDHVESEAARTVRKLSASSATTLNVRDHFRMIQFVITLANRTPRAREANAAVAEEVQRIDALNRLHDRDDYHRHFGSLSRPADELEAERLQTIDDLNTGRLFFRSSPEHELAQLALSLKDPAERLFDVLGGVCLRILDQRLLSFVIADHPVAHYDPAPKLTDAGASFLSSDRSTTWLPLSATFGVLLVQGRPGRWTDRVATPDEVRHFNLLQYAWARDAIYGRSRAAVEGVRAMAEESPQWRHEYRYRPPRIWIVERDGKATDTLIVTSHTTLPVMRPGGCATGVPRPAQAGSSDRGKRS